VKILLSNDDGYQAEGLEALRLAVEPLGAVTIVAPDRNRSGASNSLTLDVPVRATAFGTDAYYCNGTPPTVFTSPSPVYSTTSTTSSSRA